MDNVIIVKNMMMRPNNLKTFGLKSFSSTMLNNWNNYHGMNVKPPPPHTPPIVVDNIIYGRLKYKKILRTIPLSSMIVSCLKNNN
jgi:hypothetical protein